jgi:hypothetical protein
MSRYIHCSLLCVPFDISLIIWNLLPWSYVVAVLRCIQINHITFWLKNPSYPKSILNFISSLWKEIAVRVLLTLRRRGFYNEHQCTRPSPLGCVLSPAYFSTLVIRDLSSENFKYTQHSVRCRIVRVQSIINSILYGTDYHAIVWKIIDFVYTSGIVGASTIELHIAIVKVYNNVTAIYIFTARIHIVMAKKKKCYVAHLKNSSQLIVGWTRKT